MPVKSPTSTQHPYKKLLLVVAILICTNGVVASATPQLVEHRRLGTGPAIPPEWVEPFTKEWEDAFRQQEQERRRIFADMNKENSNIHVDLEGVRAKIIAGSSKRLHFEDQVTKALEELKSYGIVNMLKIIHSGRMDDEDIVRVVAVVMEGELLQKWDSVDKKTLRDLFQDLKLNEMETEMQLYANPAFTTWMNFAFYQAGDVYGEGNRIDVFRSILKVLKDEEITSKGLRNLINSEEEEKLFEKWSYVFDKQWHWHHVVN